MRALMQRSRIFFAIHQLQDQYHDNASWRAQKFCSQASLYSAG
jgi:hypothetical protein